MMRDYGKALISPGGEARVGTPGSWSLTYIAGRKGIPIGGGIKIAIPLSWSMPQSENSRGKGYVTVSTSGRAELITSIYLRWITVEVRERFLNEGDKIRVVYGDRSQGGAGAEPATVAREGVEFAVSVDLEGYRRYIPLQDSPRIKLVSAPAKKLIVTLLSTATAGKEFPVMAKAVDEWGNVDKSYRGKVKCSSTNKETALPPPCTFTPEDKGIRRFQAVFKGEGIRKIVLKDTVNGLRAESNPAHVFPDTPSFNIYWGDIHGKSNHSDGIFSPDEYYAYARDIAGLDFCSLTDHDETANIYYNEGSSVGIDEERWEKTKEVTRRYNKPGRFVTLPGYEWTHRKGHCNVYYLGGNEPYYPYYSLGSNTLTKSFSLLKNKKAIVIPHHSLLIASFEHHPRLQRLIEIFSVWGSSEYRGNPDWCGLPEDRGISVQEFLARGYRLGIIASGDNHDCLPGWLATGHRYAPFVRNRGGLVAVYAKKPTRKDIFDALWNRRTYATTGERILLDFRVNGHMMGEEFKVKSSKINRKISVKIAGTSRIERIDLIRNNLEIYTHRGKSEVEEFEYRDKEDLSKIMLKIAHPAVFYYVRVRQEDGEMAWSSPIWVEIDPEEG